MEFLLSRSIKVQLISPQSLEWRQKQLIDNGSISDRGGPSRPQGNSSQYVTIMDCTWHFLKLHFGPEIDVATNDHSLHVLHRCSPQEHAITC